MEEAAPSLGASRLQTCAGSSCRPSFPPGSPASRSRFARGVGEYGSVIFIAGNMPSESEIAPLLIITQLEEYDYAGATAIAVVMLVISFAMLLLSTCSRPGREAGASD